MKTKKDCCPTTDREMILSPNHWPKWPFLPMKRTLDKDPCVGVIIGDPIDGEVFFMPGACIFQLENDVSNKGGMVNVEYLLDQGWKVD